METIGVNGFCKRQTVESEFSHFQGTWQELVALVEESWANQEPGYKDGIVLVGFPCEGFFSAVVELDSNTVLVPEFKARREGEDKFLSVHARGEKAVAKQVKVVLYRKDVLGTDATCGTDWEIISINASAVAGAEPMNPVAMARNQLGLVGGTKTTYTSEQWAEAVLFWSTRCMVARKG